MSLKDLEPSPSDAIQASPPTARCKPPGPHSGARPHAPAPSPVAPTSPKCLPNRPPCLQRRSIPHSPRGCGALPPSYGPTAQRKLPAARIRPHTRGDPPGPDPPPPPWHTKLLRARSFQAGTVQPHSPLLLRAGPSRALPLPAGKSWGFFTLFLFLQFNIYSFAPLPVCSTESEGEDVWRRDGFFKGCCQHQLDRTRASIGAGIVPVIPSFLSNAPPPPPANAWVSL